MAHRTLDTLAAWRQRLALTPSQLTFDGLLPEASVLEALGDLRGAAAQLDPSLDGLERSDLHNMLDVVGAGTLVRAMVLRAELAARLGDDAGARRWAACVVALWSNPDDFLVPVRRRMTQLAR